MTLARSGKGTLLQFGDGATPTESFATILEVKSLAGPNETAELEDATHFESPGAYKEFITTLLDGGDLPFECNFVPGNPAQEVIRTAFQAQTPRNVRVVFPTGTRRFAFAAYVTGMTHAIPHNGAMKLNGTLKITGPITSEAHP